MSAWETFEKVSIKGFQSSKMESLVVSNNGNKVIVGTTDGAIQLYENKVDPNSNNKI